MEIQTVSWNVKQLIRMSERETLLFNYPIQRGGGQWKHLQKSYLIHSLAQSYPIPPVYFLGDKQQILNEKNVLQTVVIRWILDGKQRITTMIEFTEDRFKLEKSTPNVFIEGEEFEVADKFFSELDAEVQDMILSRSILTYTVAEESTSDEEIEDLFFRMNNGSPLTVTQKAKALMGVQWAERITKVGNHTLIEDIAAFSKTQLKADAHLTAIIQTMMMLDDYNYKNVSQKIISEYTQSFKSDSEKKIQLLEEVEKSLDYLIHVFNKKEPVLLKKVNFPMTVIAARKAIADNISHDDFYNWSIAFKEAIKENADSITYISTDYKDFTGTGSTDRHKADGRMKEMLRHLSAYMELHSK